jgi:hypothetical protein
MSGQEAFPALPDPPIRSSDCPCPCIPSRSHSPCPVCNHYTRREVVARGGAVAVQNVYLHILTINNLQGCSVRGSAKCSSSRTFTHFNEFEKCRSKFGQSSTYFKKVSNVKALTRAGRTLATQTWGSNLLFPLFPQ